MEDKEKVPTIAQSGTTRRAFLKGAVAATGGAVAIASVASTAPRAAKAEEASPMSRYLFAERQNCTGCRACEYACSTYHEGTVRPAASRVHVLRHKGIVDVPVICWHCDDAPCIEACPVTPKAIKKDKETNGIILDEKTCLGARCLQCVDACPAQYLRTHPDTCMPLFCDLCGGDPQCVKACLAQSGNPQGPCLLGSKVGFGVNQAYRDVTPEEAGEDLVKRFYYPNNDGGRR